MKTGKKEEERDRERKTRVEHEEEGSSDSFPESSRRDSWSTLCNNTQWNFTLWDRMDGRVRIERIEKKAGKRGKGQPSHEHRSIEYMKATLYPPDHQEMGHETCRSIYSAAITVIRCTINPS